MDLNNKKVLVLGAGREGASAARFIYSTFPNCRLQIADLHQSDQELPPITFLTGADYPTSLTDWDVVVVSPGIPPHTSLLATAPIITTATNLFFEHCVGSIIGVTGTKGKSTTSSLITAILQEAGIHVTLVGNIGIPALSALQKQNTQSDVWVFELSSYQTRLLERGPDIAVITSLFPEHMDYHGSVEQYYTDKLHIAEVQTKRDVLVYNHANTELRARVASAEAQHRPWPSDEGAHVRDGLICFGMETIMPVNEVPLLGEHNISNVLGAITVARELAIDKTRIAQAIRTFHPLPHRLEPVGTYHHITFYNDSLSTTPESTIAALRAITPVGSILLGGQNRGYTFDALAAEVVAQQIATVILFPESGTAIAAALTAANYAGEVHHANSMQEAVDLAFAHTPANTACVLSCASPSFTLFKNYADRGDQFKHFVTQPRT